MKYWTLLITTLFMLCNTGSPLKPVLSSYNVSECGGFQSLAKTASLPYQQDSAEYLEAEKLRWSYNDESRILDLLHTRIRENCAAEIEVDIRTTGDTLEIIENNVSDIFARCICYFDTRCEIRDVSSGNATIKIGGRFFEIDLNLSDGTVVLDTSTNPGIAHIF